MLAPAAVAWAMQSSRLATLLCGWPSAMTPKSPASKTSADAVGVPAVAAKVPTPEIAVYLRKSRRESNLLKESPRPCGGTKVSVTEILRTTFHDATRTGRGEAKVHTYRWYPGPGCGLALVTCRRGHGLATAFRTKRHRGGRCICGSSASRIREPGSRGCNPRTCSCEDIWPLPDGIWNIEGLRFARASASVKVRRSWRGVASKAMFRRFLTSVGGQQNLSGYRRARLLPGHE